MDKPEPMCPLSSFGMWVGQQGQELCNPWIAWLNTAQAQHAGRWLLVPVQWGEVSTLNQIKKLFLSTPGTHMVMTVPGGFSLGRGWDKPRKELTPRRPCTVCGVT